MTDPVIRGNSLYTVVDGPSWTQAEANAQKVGGHLVTVNNESEGHYLVQNFGDESYSAFIGLNDINQEGTLAWIDGTPAGETDLTLLYEGFWLKGRRNYVNIDEGFFQKQKGLHEGKSDLRRVLNITEFF